MPREIKRAFHSAAQRYAVEIIKIGDTEVRPLPGPGPGHQPLSGVRVLDLTRVLARIVEPDTHWGRLRYLAPVVEMSATPPGSSVPPAPLGAHSPNWLTALG